MVESEYAKAVFDLAKEENKIEVFTQCFSAVIDTKTKEFSDILVSPFIHKEEKKRILSKVYHSLDETFLHFLYVLIDHNRFDKVNDIYKEYEKLVLKDNNISVDDALKILTKYAKKENIKLEEFSLKKWVVCLPKSLYI